MGPDEWNKEEFAYEKLPFGQWKLTLPPKDGQCRVPHNSKIKVTSSFPPSRLSLERRASDCGLAGVRAHGPAVSLGHLCQAAPQGDPVLSPLYWPK